MSSLPRRCRAAGRTRVGSLPRCHPGCPECQCRSPPTIHPYSVSCCCLSVPSASRLLSPGRPRIEKRLAKLNRGPLSFLPGRIGRKRIGWNRLIVDRAAVVELDEDARCPAPGTPDRVGLQDISFIGLAKSHAVL